MTWHIDFTENSQKNLDRLDKQIAARIVRHLFEKVMSLENPRLIGSALHGPNLRKYWKYRIGDYRVIAHILDEKKIIQIISVGHRREVYR